jgi:multidrug efflux pump subunit AcrB
VNITQLALKNDRTTLVLLLVLVLAGIQAYIDMPRAYDPGFIIRTAQVITHFPGASPERVEQLISDKLEKLIQEIPELDFVKSESRTGVSIVQVNIREEYKDMRPIWDSLRRKIDKAADLLPEGVIGPDVNDEFGDVFGIILTLTGEGYDYAELKAFADDAKNALLRIDDAAKVEILGTQEERVFLEYNNARLAELNLSPSQILMALSSRNIVAPGGAITLGSERISLEPSGNFESLEEVENTLIQIPGGNNVVLLKDLVVVRHGFIDPPGSLVNSTGDSALALAVSMREGGNNIFLGEQVEQVVGELRQSYPIGIEFDVISFSPKEVEDKVNSFISNLLQAVAVVALVMLLSLGIRTGLVVAALIPLSMVAAILVMSFFGIGLDQISLAALIIALGMLVDNGIVMSENIMVQMAAGKKPVDAALASANELRVPLLTSSLTTAAAFLPIFLAESSTGEFTASLFKVVSITLLCSWVLSLTVIPLLCVRFLKVKARPEEFDAWYYRLYRRLLVWVLHHGAAVLVVIGLLFASAIYTLGFVPKVFFPPSDRLYFKAELELPQGTDIHTTEDMVQKIERFVSDNMKAGEDRPEGVTNWISYIGSGGARFVLSHNPKPSSSNYALMVLNTTSAEIIDPLMLQLGKYAGEQFPDLQFQIKRIENGAAVNKPVEIRVSGNDTTQLFRIVEQIKKIMAEAPALTAISDDWGFRVKKLRININQQRALRAGVSSEDIALSLQTGLSGLELTEFRDGEEIIPVVLRSVSQDRTGIDQLEAISVYAQASGQSVPLKQVADIELVWDPARVFRRDRLKTVTVGALLQPGQTANEGFAQILPRLEQDSAEWPSGYLFEAGGEAESSAKANQSIFEKLPLAAFIIIILLVGQFNSLRKPLIILVTIPLGVIGVIFGLFIARSFIGFMALLGIISLAGIVINNAIVLLERIKLEIEENGLPPAKAIIEAAQRRMVPILLTTTTTVFGLIPLYLGGGEMWEPLAIAIIGGLLFSTLLTLGVVPLLYSMLYRIKIQ